MGVWECGSVGVKSGQQSLKWGSWQMVKPSAINHPFFTID